MKYIQLKSKEQFREVMQEYDKKHKLHMWDLFKETTCYIPEEDCFISLDKAIKFKDDGKNI